MNFIEKFWKGKNYRLFAKRDRNHLWLSYDGKTWLWKEEKPVDKKIKTSTIKKQGLIKANLPGRIQKIFVKKSDKVKKGKRRKGRGDFLQTGRYCQQGSKFNRNKIQLVKFIVV